MFIDKDGEVFEYTDIHDDGRTVVHHHGTKVLSPEQNERFSEIMSRAWDNLPEQVRDEIYEKMMLEHDIKEDLKK
jgi:truncated hemoglobin YjbI